LSRLNRELRAISNCNQTLLRATDEHSLLHEICRIVCEEAGYRMAWVAYAEHDEAKSVRPAAWTGAEEGYLANLGITWADTERGWGPTGTAIRSGKTCCIQDFATDPRLAPWQESALQHDFHSGIALPLKDEHAHAFGSLTIYSAQPNAFTPAEIRLLEELAADLAFGIVTLRSRAARERAEQEVALLSFAVDRVREAALLIDDRGRFQYVNEEACLILGYSRAELLGMGVSDIDPEFPAERWPDHWRELKAQRSLSFESRHRSRDGHTFPVEVSANYFEYGDRAYNLALVRDITERKRAEEKVRQQEMELRQVLDFTPQLVAVFGPGRKRLYANRPTLDYFGITLQEWQGISDRFWFYHPDDRERMARDVYTGLASDGPHEFEARMRRKDGAYRWFLFRDNPLRDEHGFLIRWYVTATDIEDRKRAEEERRARVWFLESMDQVNRAMQGTNDLEQMTGDVIGAMLSIFESDRAFLYYPCDPDARSFQVFMQRTRPEYPAARGVIPMTPDTARGFQIVRASSGVVTFGPGCDYPLVGDFAKRFGHQSSMGIALYPRIGKPWVLTMHQCSYPRIWTADERKLLEEIARRLTDSLTSLLMFHSLRESEEALRRSEAYLASAQKLTHTGTYAMNGTSREPVYWSEEMFRLFGTDPKEALLKRDQVWQRIHPEDHGKVKEASDRAFLEKVDSEVEYRIVWSDGTVKLVHTLAHPVLSANGEVAEVVATMVDITGGKRAEEALRAQAALLDLTHDTVFVMDMEGVIKYWNRGAGERYGWTAEHALGRVVHDLLKTVFPGPLEEIRAEVSRTGRWEGEILHTKKDGTQVVVASRWALQRDERGAPVAILETNNDITLRKQAEEALRLSNAYNRSLIEASLDPLVTIGPHGEITDVNAATEAATGRSRGELVGTDFCDYFTEPAKARAGYEQVFREGMVRDYPLELRHRDGGVMSVLYNASVYRDESGHVIGVFAAARDISKRKRAEEALRESETRFRTFVDHAADALFIYDFEQGTIVDVNRQACESLGYTRQELIGTMGLAFHQNVDRAVTQSIAERTAAGKTVIDTHWHLRKDGTQFPVEAHSSQYRYGGRRFLLKVARDISDRARAEEQRERLRQLEADLAHINRVSMLGELTASIAHEVNQPLSGVVSNGSACLRWLAGDVPNVEEAREAARRIVRDGKRAGDVIARIRALTKRAATPREKLDLNETILDVLALVGDEAKRKGVTIRTQFVDDLSPVSGDRVQLQQVLLNLTMNAIEAMSSVDERARELLIITRNIAADQVEVTVKDSGPGIDPNTLDRIFDPFYTTKPGGMGMGLSISRSILQAHGGRLWVAAKDGPGTIFHFTLPKYQEIESNAGA
jgi:PAS domain S-box-containing protein